jgi:YD repeat-containing protein
VQSPDAGTTSYVYDPAGNLKTKTDAGGIRSTYTYDVLNRLIRMSFPAANGQSGYSVVYGYDQRTNGKGHLTDIADPSGSTRFDYDSRGRLQVKTSRINDKDFVISRLFTPGGRVTQITTPTGRTVDYERTSRLAPAA